MLIKNKNEIVPEKSKKNMIAEAKWLLYKFNNNF